MTTTTPTSVSGQPAGRPFCAICQCTVEPGEATTACPACAAAYHANCWAENGGCAVYGCAQVPATENRTGVEIPASYWGQTNKPCPMCGQTILAAALRCRHCGATFATARPQEPGEFVEQTRRQAQSAALRRRAVWVFVGCVVPFVAPVAALVGGLWYANNRKAIEALPATHLAMCRIGLAVGAGQTVLFVLLALLFAVFRAG